MSSIGMIFLGIRSVRNVCGPMGEWVLMEGGIREGLWWYIRYTVYV